jgi:hypothetical protein
MGALGRQINLLGSRLLLMREEAVELLTRTTDAVERAALVQLKHRLEDAVAVCDVERCPVCGLGTPTPCAHAGCTVVACGDCLAEAHVAIYGEEAERRCPKAPVMAESVRTYMPGEDDDDCGF